LLTFNDKTILSIAHRIHTLKNAHRIIVIDNATITEQGTHEELVKLNGIYSGFLANYVSH
jgi:ATP-binding cassette subfamily B protein